MLSQYFVENFQHEATAISLCIKPRLLLCHVHAPIIEVLLCSCQKGIGGVDRPSPQKSTCLREQRWYASNFTSILASSCVLGQSKWQKSVSLMVQSKKRGLSIDEKKQVVLQMFHESKDCCMLKVCPIMHDMRLLLPAIVATSYWC